MSLGYAAVNLGHPEQPQITFLIPDLLKVAVSCRTQRAKEAGISGRFRRHELAKGWGWHPLPYAISLLVTWRGDVGSIIL